MTEEKKTATRKTTTKTEATKKTASPRKPAAKKTTTTKSTTGAPPKGAAQSTQEKASAVVKINGKNYPLDALNENAKAQIANLRVTDRHIEELEAELAIARTARGSYSSVLERELNALDNETLQ